MLLTTCSGCMAQVKVDLDRGTATARKPSNGIRGARHVPAHDVTVDVIIDSAEILAHFDCPLGCGMEADSVYVDDETRRALT